MTGETPSSGPNSNTGSDTPKGKIKFNLKDKMCSPTKHFELKTKFLLIIDTKMTW